MHMTTPPWGRRKADSSCQRRPGAALGGSWRHTRIRAWAGRRDRTAPFSCKRMRAGGHTFLRPGELSGCLASLCHKHTRPALTPRTWSSVPALLRESVYHCSRIRLAWPARRPTRWGYVYIPTTTLSIIPTPPATWQLRVVMATLKAACPTPIHGKKTTRAT